MNEQDIIDLLKDKIEQAKKDLRESKSAGVNSPGFNQDLGAYDALVSLLSEIMGE